MKRSWKTRVTALMFSAAAIGAGALSVSCGVYRSPGVSETNAEIDLAAMTNADFRIITDEQLIALGRQSHD